MTWLRVDDRFHEHPKIVQCSVSAVGLWLLCATWASGRKDRDGFIPRALPARFGERNTSRMVRQLVDAGLWEPVDGGWAIHDFEHYGPSQDLSEKRAAAGRKGGLKTQATAKASASAKSSTGSPVPVPVNTDLPFGQISAQPAVLVPGNSSDPVGVFVDTCRELGLADPDTRTKARIGSEARRLLGEGRSGELIAEAIREVARRNCSPALLSTIAGDIERERKGIDTSRRRPTTNPVSQRIQSFSAFSDAEKSGKLP